MFLFLCEIDSSASSNIAVGNNIYAPSEQFFMSSDQIDKYVTRSLEDSGYFTVVREATPAEYLQYSDIHYDYTDARYKYYLERWNLFYKNKLLPSPATTGDIAFFNGTDWSALPPGALDTVLTSNGALTAPSWEVAAGGPGGGGYDTLWVPSGAMTGRLTSGASLIPTEVLPLSGVNMDVLTFDQVAKQYVDFTLIMPEAWDQSTIKAKFAWTYPTAPVGGTTVEWEISGYAVSNLEDLNSLAGTSQVISDTINTPLYNHLSAATPAITIANNPALGDIINFTIARNVVNDDMDELAYLIGVWIQYNKTLTPVVW